MGRVGTHRHQMSSGWGPSGRWFKSSRPDIRKPASEAVRPSEELDFPRFGRQVRA